MTKHRRPAPPTTRMLGRPPSRDGAAAARRLAARVPDAIRRDITAPPPLLLLPMRLEYRVVEANAPITMAGNVAALFRDATDITIEGPPRHERPDPRPRPRPRWHLDPRRVTFTTQREIWFRWYPDEDFSLHGIAPASEAETAALARFDAASGGKPWHALDEAAVVSAWQALSREIAPERALHLLRHRGEPGDPDHLEVIGRIPLLPEKVALFALDGSGGVTLLAEGAPIDRSLRYSMANVQAGGWHTDFDAALRAGMAVRLRTSELVVRALEAQWIIAVGLAKDVGAADVAAMIDDQIANGAFEFLQQDTPTNNTPHESTPYQSPRSDLLAFLETAADAEQGVLASPLTQSAELLAEALGIGLRHVATAPNSGDLAFEDARAMLRVVGPALIDTALDHTAALGDISEEEVIEFFAEAIVARGPLPAVRFGKNPYGVLPVIDLSRLAALKSDTERTQRIEAFVRDFARVIVAESQLPATAFVPVLEPGDPNATAKLETILKLNPVSRRVDVGQVATNTRALGCDYVTSSQHPVAQYLADLGREPIVNLPDPTYEDPTYPLLYRLARLSLWKTIILPVATTAPLADVRLSTRVHLAPEERERLDVATANVARLPLESIVSGRVPVIRGRAAGPFLAGLQRLEAIAAEPNGVAKLETLLMETIDLFQHRIDAWATGIAYRRLVKRRRAGRRGLVGGYWGVLGRPRADSVTGRSDGYLQAPSPHQAVTTAILRSAHLRHRDGGAFAIGLDSVRVRRGLRLLEMLQAGLSPGEALGYIAERKLHERHQDVLIFRLRDLFPLRDPRDDAALETRLSDGLAFLKANLAGTVPGDELAALTALQTDLRDDFDALADIVLAEATHLRAMGQAEGANAWLQVLSGETVPGLPSVLRTRRNGHGSTHRIAVLIDPIEPQPTDAVRAIAEPSLAALVAARLQGFDSAVVAVSIEDPDAGTSVNRQFALRADLGMAPVDLLVGGESEVLLRARHHLVSLWRGDAALEAEAGVLPERDVATFINQVRPVTIGLDAGSPTVRQLLDAAAELRRAVAQGRMLEPSDLSAAADPAIPLTDVLERDVLAGTCTALARRASLLGERLAADLAALTAAMGPVVASARNVRRLIDDNADASSLALAITDLDARRQSLDAALLAVSRYAEPGALRFTTTLEMHSDPDALERSLTSLVARLSRKASALASAVTAASPGTASEARAQRGAMISALKAALDGDAQPVLPPLPRIAATTPQLDPNALAVAEALAAWQPVRAKVARVMALFGASPWRAHASSASATSADDPDADPRTDEALAPRARLFGTFVATSNPSSAPAFAGFVADEWAEQRPSRLQQTGLAINYDSPQSEPPHALLLCEPTGPGAPAWTLAAAAAMVAQTVALMKTRALTAQDRPLPGPLFPFANQVPFIQLPRRPLAPRIPTRPFKFNPVVAVAEDAIFLVDATTPDVGVSGGGLSEISGFSKVRD